MVSPPDVANPAWLDSVLDSLPPDFLTQQRYCFALSGGLDSVSLLCFFVPILRARGGLLRAIHVHHGLSSNADAWADFCRSLCEQNQVSCQIHKVQVLRDGSGLEAAARKARYDVFRRELLPSEVLLQGHHQDDQAETVLLRLMRGATPDELAAIPQQRTLGQGRLFRPWLGVSRQVLLAAAQQAGLRWIEDESNQDQALDRNFLRQAVLPVLAQRWPQARAALARVAAQAGQNQLLLDHLFAPELAATIETTLYGPALNLDAVRNLTPLHRNALIRRWLKGLSIPQIPAVTLQRLEREVLGAGIGAAPELRWGPHSVRVYRGRLFYVAVSEERVSDQFFALKVADLPLSIDMGGWRVQLCWQDSNSPDAGAELASAIIGAAFPDGNFMLRCKRQKDALRLPSGQHQSLQQVFQDVGIPPWWRPRWPMLFADNTLVCAGPGKVDPAYRHDSGGDKGKENCNAKRHLVIRWSLIERLIDTPANVNF